MKCRNMVNEKKTTYERKRRSTSNRFVNGVVGIYKNSKVAIKEIIYQEIRSTAP